MDNIPNDKIGSRGLVLFSQFGTECEMKILLY